MSGADSEEQQADEPDDDAGGETDRGELAFLSLELRKVERVKSQLISESPMHTLIDRICQFQLSHSASITLRSRAGVACVRASDHVWCSCPCDATMLGCTNFRLRLFCAPVGSSAHAS